MAKKKKEEEEKKMKFKKYTFWGEKAEVLIT